MSRDRQRVVVTDASVLINFAWIDRFDLFGMVDDYEFWVPAGVAREVLRPDQAEALEVAFTRGDLRHVDMEEEGLQAARQVQRRHRLGLGESLCLALAERHSGWIACDEKVVRFRNAVQETLGPGRVLNTAAVVVLALRQSSLSLADADAFIEVWRRNRYQVEFSSFVEVMNLEEGGGSVAEELQFASWRFFEPPAEAARG